MRALVGHRRILLGVVSLIGALALIGVALALAKTQRDARRTVEQRFATGSGTAAALVQTIVTQAYAGDAAVGQRTLSGTLTPARLAAAAQQVGSPSIAVLDDRGRVLAARPAGTRPVASGGPFLRQALAGQPAITGAVGPRRSQVVEVLVPFAARKGRRVLVVSTPVGRVQVVLGPYLRSLPGLTGHRAYILDRSSARLADSRPDAPRDTALFAALRDRGPAARGSYNGDGRYLSSTPIGGTSWLLVDTTRTSVLYSPVSGWQRNLPWLLLLLFIPLGVFVVVLAERSGRSAERAAEASQAKSSFLASMSHELRTPMTTVIGFSEMLYEGKVGPLTDRQRGIVGHIVTSSKHLNQLISEVLDLSRVEQGRMAFHPEDASPHLLAAEVTEGMSGLAADRDIAIDLNAPDIGTVRLDPARFKQVLYNLIGNAIKFTEAGGRVVVTVRRDDDGVLVIEVTDDGPGIAAGELEKIFLPFEQGTRRNGGAGLGLAVSRRIVDAQGGTIAVMSQPGQGSTFTVTLPPASTP